MTMNKRELINYRISRSDEAYKEAILLAENQYWNTVANRLYYSCFYLLNALLIKYDINFSSHNGVKTAFHQYFVKVGSVSLESGKVYSRLFSLRQEGDYVDFQRFTSDEILPFFESVQQFRQDILNLIEET